KWHAVDGVRRPRAATPQVSRQATKFPAESRAGTLPESGAHRAPEGRAAIERRAAVSRQRLLPAPASAGPKAPRKAPPEAASRDYPAEGWIRTTARATCVASRQAGRTGCSSGGAESTPGSDPAHGATNRQVDAPRCAAQRMW